MPYRPFALMTAAAGRTELWRLVLGIVLVLVITFGLQQAFMALSAALLPDDAYWSMMAQMRAGDTPLGMLVLLLNMGAMGVAALVAAQLMHRRRAVSLLGPWTLFVPQFLRCLVAVGAVTLAALAMPPWPMAGEMTLAMPAGRWLALLPVTLLALLVQTGSEELLFRGYLQSQLGARLAHPVAWLVLPSVLFALGHWSPDMYGENALLVALWAFGFGVAAADLTARTGTLGPALAMHLVNNVVAIALMSPQGVMSGLALYLLPFGPGDEAALRALLPLDLAGILLSWLAARLALRV
ncbi:MAG: CPBP family intramembrane glutamic endopeptidase [Salipiger thiooxidans]|uniref:CPBP family intramembrane glutamic endopeptidase n=1 Tax=Salipiger thiooxidans TaxID=282683 RepID=UPI001CF9458A|nr:CPBP family intramembrane glutamic endopeptidase [Salipiger thiooxidans]